MGNAPTLDRRTYRWVDRATKLAGVATVAVALEAGIATGAGIALALAGAALALSTVPIAVPEEPDATAGSTDVFEGDIS